MKKGMIGKGHGNVWATFGHRYRNADIEYLFVGNVRYISSQNGEHVLHDIT